MLAAIGGLGIIGIIVVIRVVLPMLLQRFRLTAVPGTRVDRRVTTILSPRHPMPMRLDRAGRPYLNSPVVGDVHEMVHLPMSAAAAA